MLKCWLCKILQPLVYFHKQWEFECIARVYFQLRGFIVECNDRRKDSQWFGMGPSAKAGCELSLHACAVMWMFFRYSVDYIFWPNPRISGILSTAKLRRSKLADVLTPDPKHLLRCMTLIRRKGVLVNWILYSTPAEESCCSLFSSHFVGLCHRKISSKALIFPEPCLSCPEDKRINAIYLFMLWGEKGRDCQTHGWCD